ncbi:hypothetical protein B5X24_HaOG212953 [Helicoverpa armigera]|uniref:Uncharacterized protein n=1 Tax=Helicoverpa armigera TaxID=29058 RepID=A0A2W1BFH7_HELAM|nr:hypothetical protein B5X24_HaOG212953 [Helicoverpa armigera]
MPDIGTTKEIQNSAEQFLTTVITPNLRRYLRDAGRGSRRQCAVIVQKLPSSAPADSFTLPYLRYTHERSKRRGFTPV